MNRPRIMRPVIAKQLTYKPTAVLVGVTGAGKSTLYNILCKKTRKAGSGKGSVTMTLAKNDVCYGHGKMELIDTPGTDSAIDTYKHAVLLKKALTCSPINTVFVLLEYNSRFNKLTAEFLEQPLEWFNNRLVVMISHMDKSEDVERDFNGIKEVFEEDCPDIANLIFYSKNCDPTSLANLMFACASNMEPKKINISSAEFATKFTLYNPKGQEVKWFKSYEQSAIKLKNEFNVLRDKAKNEDSAERDHILHMLIIEFRRHIDLIQEDFRKKYFGSVSEDLFYGIYFKMQKHSVRLCDDFVASVEPLMGFSLFDSGHPRNMIKRCPHCKLVWFKTEGCDGTTTCGNRSSTYYDSFAASAFRYVMKKVGDVFCYEKQSMKEKQELPQKSQTGKGVGCGMEIVWSALPAIEDQLILELLKVKTMDEAVAKVNSVEFKEFQSAYETNIDTAFEQV